MIYPFNQSKRFNNILYAYLFLGMMLIGYLFFFGKKAIAPTQRDLWFSLAYGYWICFSFILAQIGLGNALLRLPILRDCKLSGGPRLLFSLAIGFYISNCFLTFIAIFKWMDEVGIFIYLILATPFIFYGGITVYDTLFHDEKTHIAPSDSNPAVKNKWSARLIGGLVLLWTLPYFIQTLLPNSDWDGAWQHLPLPKLFLEKGISWVTPDFMQFDFPGAIHLVYALFFFIKSETAIIPINFIIGISIVITSYYFANHFFGKPTAQWAAAITAAINIIWEVSLTPRIDSFLAFFCVLAVYAFFLWIQDHKKSGFLIITGMMLGMAIGTKYTAVIFVFALGILTVIHLLIDIKQKPAAKTLLLITAVITLLIPSGWWYMRNTIQLGDPLYPFLSEIFFYGDQGERIKLYPALNTHIQSMPPREEIETVFSENGLEVFSNWEKNADAHPKRNPFKFWRIKLFNIWDILFHPDKFARKPYHEINPFLLLFVLLPFFDRRKIPLYLYGISAFCFTAIAVKAHILRYLLPVFPLFAIGAARVLSYARSKKLVYFFAILLAGCLVRFAFFETKKLVDSEPIAYLSSKYTKIEWLEHVGYNSDKTTPPFINFINQQVDNGFMSKTDTIFMIGEGKGNLLKCKYVPDSSRSGLPWLVELIKSNNQYSEIVKNLEKSKIRFIAVNYFYLYWAYENNHYDKKPLIFGLYHLQQFLENHTEIIYNHKGMVIAKIKY